MLTIRCSADMARALGSVTDLQLRRLLALRRDQLLNDTNVDLGTLAHFLVITPGDTIVTVEAGTGVPLTEEDAAFEWVRRHAGDWLEAAMILNDDGFALVLLVLDAPGTDPDLLAALLAHV